MNARNFKFLNKTPLILGFELFDCAQAVVASLLFYAFTSNYFFTLVIGFSIVLVKSAYRKMYPKNTIFFFRTKKDGINAKYMFKNLRRNKNEIN